MCKTLTISAISILVIPIIGVTIWYGSSFYPYVEEISEISKRGSNSVKSINSNFHRIVEIAESRKGIRIYAARQSYRSLAYDEHQSTLSWHVSNALWYFSSYLHFDDDEIFGVWVDCLLFGCGKGINTAAVKYYGLKLQNLSERELIGLAVLVRSPTRYKPGSDCSEKRINEIVRLAIAS